MNAEEYYKKLVHDLKEAAGPRNALSSQEIRDTFSRYRLNVPPAAILEATPESLLSVNGLLDTLLDQILSGLPPEYKVERGLPRILCRSFFTGDPNGLALAVPGSSEFLILVDPTLFAATNDFSRVAVLAESEDVPTDLVEDATYRVQQAVAAFYREGEYVSPGLKELVTAVAKQRSWWLRRQVG